MTTKKLQERFQKLKTKNEKKRAEKKQDWDEIDEFLKPGIGDVGFENPDRVLDENSSTIIAQRAAFELLKNQLDLIDQDLDPAPLGLSKQ